MQISREKNYNNSGNRLTRIGVFYDGNYFLHVSNYYNYVHPLKKRLSIAGLHKFIKQRIADQEGIDQQLCRISEAHYFKGRIGAQEAAQRGNQLYYERVFDDILMSEGLVTHYFPIKSFHGKREEKNIDVHLALEAYDMATSGKMDILVLIASDGDFVPLIRKINAMGIKVMLICWDFEFFNDEGQKTITRTSQGLLKEVCYPLQMHDIIESQGTTDAHTVNGLFVNDDTGSADRGSQPVSDVMENGEILSLKNGYGFIKYPNNNLFFHYTDVVNIDFNELITGDLVEFIKEKRSNGQEVARNVKKLD